MADKMQRMDDESAALVTEIMAEFASMPQVTRLAVVRAAMRWMKFCIQQYRARGYDTARIWRDINRGG